jgi:nitroimidazol reductase NimA-like FMN-containing flavoprotein (pyridoxamine 5'-phosphate oxidase superfamily)
MPTDNDAMSDMPRGLLEVSRAEALRLLGTVPYGRVVFTLRALPAIRPVNHIVDRGDIVIRTGYGAALAGAAGEGVVVAYEADEIDPEHQSGWSVIVTGLTQMVTNDEDVERYRRLLRPWVGGAKDAVIRIRPAFVTGNRLVAAGFQDQPAGRPET